MKKIILFVVLFCVVIFGYIYFNKTSIFNCYDCGSAGWQIMSGVECNKTNFTKEGFKRCLLDFSWPDVDLDTNIDEINEGYIKIGESKISSEVFEGAIKVLIFYQWAVDESGVLYLLEQLG